MRENRANKYYNIRLTRWVDILLPFNYFTIDHHPGSKMGLVDHISRDPQQKAVNIAVYDEQFIVAKSDVIKRSAKRFVINAENFAARNQLTKQASNIPHFINKLCSKFAPQNPENSPITENDNTISKLTPNNSNSNTQIEPANIPNSFFALNQPTKQSPKNSNNFQGIASKF